MGKMKLAVPACALFAAVMLSGCNKYRPKKFYSDAVVPEQVISEDVTAKTEFPEYDRHVKKIKVIATNNGDTDFFFGEQYSLQKLEDGEWKYIVVGGIFPAIGRIFPASETSDHTFSLEDHVKLPLPSGSYRIGVGFEPYPMEFDRIVYAEFTVK